MRDGWIGADMRVSWGEIGGKRVIRWVGGAKAGFGLLRRVRKRIIHGYGVGFIGGGNEFRDEGMEKGEGNREGTWICKELVGGLGREKGLSMLVWGLLELDL